MRSVPRPIRVALLAALLAGCGGQVVGVLSLAEAERQSPEVQPHFLDVTPLTGIDLVSVSRLDIAGYGQGAAVADFDGDGDLDIFLTQDVGPCRLYRNLGSMQFGDVAAFAGVQVSSGEAHAKAAAAFDFDRDGHTDLFVGTCGEGNRLFRNRGDGTFEDVSAASGIGGGTDFTLSAHPGDYDGDGLLDLYEVNCVPTDYAAPNQHSPLPARNRLWRNQGDGTFVDMAPLLGVDDPLAAWAAQWIDLDGDGDQDLLLPNDAFFYPGADVNDRAFINSGAEGGFLFEDRAADYGLDERHYGMGFSAGDLDGDGLLDLFSSDLGPSELRLGSDPTPWPDRAAALGVEIGFDEGMRHQVTWGT
ncbi:MAG TPA: VCBS repeat-containing protein, partial [Planctomycetota bacterium]|nr:VCBS repeat-containing protein [Planctomycetota bacterium]